MSNHCMCNQMAHFVDHGDDTRTMSCSIPTNSRRSTSIVNHRGKIDQACTLVMTVCFEYSLCVVYMHPIPVSSMLRYCCILRCLLYTQVGVFAYCRPGCCTCILLFRWVASFYVHASCVCVCWVLHCVSWLALAHVTRCLVC